MRDFSIMQGRTLKSENNKIQYFPFENWKKEFLILNKLKIKKLQWIYENSKNKINPILQDNFYKKNIIFKKKFNVYINSICADEFIKKPIFINSSVNKKAIKELFNIIEISKKNRIKYIIIPFVDNSSIFKKDYKKLLINFINEIYYKIEQNKVEIHLETDIQNKEIVKIINLTNSKKFIKINFDSGNTVSFGYDLKNEINDAKGHIGSVHLKDRIKFGYTVPLGYGDVDFSILFKALKRIKFKGDYVIQAARIKNMDDKLLIKKYLNFLKKF